MWDTKDRFVTEETDMKKYWMSPDTGPDNYSLCSDIVDMAVAADNIAVVDIDMM